MQQQMLSPHFSFEELSITNLPSFKAANIAAAKEYRQNLAVLANYILEPARTLLKTPLIITSAYRCPALNRAVGGSETSQHLSGQAADFTLKNMPLKEAFDILKQSGLINYGQLIYEGRWIHISLGAPFRPLERCAQALEIL